MMNKGIVASIILGSVLVLGACTTMQTRTETTCTDRDSDHSLRGTGTEQVCKTSTITTEGTDNAATGGLVAGVGAAAVIGALFAFM